MDINGCAAIVTGGGTGMGAAAARALARKGAKVAVLGRRLDVLRTVAEEVGGLAVACDVADADSVVDAFGRAAEAHGTARVLVHAAANGSMVPLILPDGAAQDLSKLNQIVETNVLGTLHTNQEFASCLSRVAARENGERGLIINVSSIGAADGVVGSTYVMSKAAIDGFCLSAARELSPFGIRVMTIAPGAIDSEMFRSGATKETYALIADSVPSPKRLGTPEEFANLVTHICQNDYLNGSIIRLDGGMRIPFVANVGGASEISTSQ